MIVVMKPHATNQQVEAVRDKIQKMGLEVHGISGEVHVVLGVVGDTARVDKGMLSLIEGVERIVPVAEPFKKANRKMHPENSIINVSGVEVGGTKLTLIAGPCSIEGVDQITGIAKEVKANGASLLRGGAYKPRTSPYSFQGLGEEGLEMLLAAKKETGLPIVTEMMDPRQADLFQEKVDCVQIGARNMQNYDLLKEVGKMNRPILLKRAFSATIDEWLMSAEYIMSEGNENVILCERGIRTFSNYTRNTLDLSAIPVVKSLSHLPIVVDPSHACGKSQLVPSMSLAAIAAGADGLIIEVHNNPCEAWCDGAQSITPDEFLVIKDQLAKIAPIVGRTI